ncbi:MAG TPA: hypothetical protein PK509_11050 [Catalimonadaceae bacterium]|nr:hypothetical protein [Catalimonadaceae bacterium]HPI11684.1 hypothetical protein [Catalimonadaceae bacterium]
MVFIRRIFLPVFIATLWISVSEFGRNEFLFKTIWIEHYRNLEMIFPADPINGAFWGVWSLFFAILIFVISRRFTQNETTLIAWFAGFGMMWIVVWNMKVLPLGIFPKVLPLSFLEAYVATLIIRKISPAYKNKISTPADPK